MIGRWERRAPEVAELIRQAFLRGIPTRGVGRVIALVTEEAVSAQTVSRLTRVLDRQVEAFHQERLDDAWVYLILDGVWMKVRRAWGPQRVLLLVAYGVRPNGERQSGWGSCGRGARARRLGRAFCRTSSGAACGVVTCG